MAQDSGLAEPLITPVGWRAEPTGDGLRRVDLPDGSFHLRAAEDIPIGARYIDGESTWELVKYGGFVDRIEVPRTIRFTAEAPDLRSPAERALGTTRIDATGRVWQLVEIDEDALRAKVDALLRLQPEPGGARSYDDFVRRREATESEYAVGEVVEWSPQNWVHENCVGLPTVMENHTWEGEGRTPIAGTHSRGERPAVSLFSPAGTCTGTLVSDDEILTAAHCVATCTNQNVALSSIIVCLDGPYGSGNPACVFGNVDGVAIAPGYSGGDTTCNGTDFARDWAVVSLATPIANWSTSGAVLSSAADSTLLALDRVQSFGMDAFLTPNCTPNGTQTTVGVMLRQTEVEPIASVTTDTVRLKIDNAPGGSGRPHYYCPSGVPCNFTTGVPYVFGTLSGWNAATNRAVGPKIWPIWVNIVLNYD